MVNRYSGGMKKKFQEAKHSTAVNSATRSPQVTEAATTAARNTIPSASCDTQRTRTSQIPVTQATSAMAPAQAYQGSGMLNQGCRVCGATDGAGTTCSAN